MNESLESTSDKAGLPPGSLVHVGASAQDSSTISLVDYSVGSHDQRRIDSIEQAFEYKASETVTWVIIEGLGNVEIVAEIGKEFGIHQLVLEDILNTHQRPKFEEYDNYLYIVLKSITSGNEEFIVTYEQISLLVLENFVFVFKEKKDELFQPVMQRIRTSKGRFRSLGSDYLMYVILDSIIDQCFILTDCLDDAINRIEDSLLSAESTQQTLNNIQRLKREIVHIRRYISPVRELMNAILRSESPLIHEKTHIYLSDVYDHSLRITESIESYRDILSGLLDIYISNVSNRMNEVMKVLTVFASIFIPLTFLAGIYGMNFEYMPELKWKWAYPTLWLLFIMIPIVLLIYFKRKKWL